MAWVWFLFWFFATGMFAYVAVFAASLGVLLGRNSAELEIVAGGGPAWSPWWMAARVLSWQALRDDLARVSDVVQRSARQRGLQLPEGNEQALRLTSLLQRLNFLAEPSVANPWYRTQVSDVAFLHFDRLPAIEDLSKFVAALQDEQNASGVNQVVVTLPKEEALNGMLQVVQRLVGCTPKARLDFCRPEQAASYRGGVMARFGAD